MYPTISVIIPTYNRASELVSCLASLSFQMYEGRIQIIIVDDASADTAIKDLANAYQALYIRLECRYGSAYAKNIGLLHAIGEFVLFLDSDIEFVTSKTLMNMIKIFKIIPNCGEVGGEAILDAQGRVKYVFGRNIDLETGSSCCKYINVDDLMNYNQIVEFDYIPTSNCMISREMALRIGGFDDAYVGLGEDKDFGYRLKNLGLRNYISKDSAVLHRFSPNGRQGSALAKQYRTQIRFCLRNFGLLATFRLVLCETAYFINRYIKPAEWVCSSDPAIQKFETYYRDIILQLDHSISYRRQLVRSSLTFWSAFLWNFIRLKGLFKSGKF